MDEEIKKEDIVEKKTRKKTAKKSLVKEIKPNKVWCIFTTKSNSGRKKVLLPYALAVKLEKGGNVKIVKKEVKNEL